VGKPGRGKKVLRMGVVFEKKLRPYFIDSRYSSLERSQKIRAGEKEK